MKLGNEIDDFSWIDIISSVPNSHEKSVEKRPKHRFLPTLYGSRPREIHRYLDPVHPDGKNAATIWC